MFLRNIKVKFLWNIKKNCDSTIKPSFNIQTIRNAQFRTNCGSEYQTEKTVKIIHRKHQHYQNKNVKVDLIIAGMAPFFAFFQKKEENEENQTNAEISPFFASFKKKEENDENQTLVDKIKKLFLPDFILVLFQERDYSPEGQLIMNIKLSIVDIHRKEYDKAEQLLHLALRMAQDLQHFNAITLCFDIMANLAFERGQLDKAEKLFVAVMQRLMQKGSKEDDIEILHLGLKVAEIAECQGQLDKAEQGYVWALGKLESKIKSTPDPKDLTTLYGLANDYYGRLLMRKGQYIAAKDYLKKSYDIFIDVNNKNDPEVIDLLNNLAVVHTHLNDLTAAEVYINQALKLAENYHDMQDTAVYQANYGIVLIKEGLLEKAKKVCEKALQSARENKNSDGKEQATYCLEQLKELLESKQET